MLTITQRVQFIYVHDHHVCIITYISRIVYNLRVKDELPVLGVLVFGAQVFEVSVFEIQVLGFCFKLSLKSFFHLLLLRIREYATS